MSEIKCQCSHEAGDSDCPKHPTCPGCGEGIAGTAIVSEAFRLLRRARQLIEFGDGQGNTLFGEEATNVVLDIDELLDGHVAGTEW